MLHAKVYVTLKPSVLDAQGQAVAASLGRLGFGEVRDVRVGKYVELAIDGVDARSADQRLAEMCRRLLANTIIEEFRYEVSAPASVSATAVKTRPAARGAVAKAGRPPGRPKAARRAGGKGKAAPEISGPAKGRGKAKGKDGRGKAARGRRK